MEDFRFKVNLGGMIEILSDHLYSSLDVFVRELLQNGVENLMEHIRMNPQIPEAFDSNTPLTDRAALPVIEKSEEITVAWIMND